jgi:hypothetical protein
MKGGWGVIIRWVNLSLTGWRGARNVEGDSVTSNRDGSLKQAQAAADL